MNLEATLEALRKNGFDACSVKTEAEARELFFSEILSAIAPRTVSRGDSATLERSLIPEELASRADIEFIDPFAGGGWDETLETSRRGLLSDLFLAGCNAVTEKGQLVNLDMVGNRVAGITFGPRRVVLLAGASKIARDRESAMERIRSETAPWNARRNGDLRTPCQKTGVCSDCSSPDRICNAWSILEKCWPRGRITVILIENC